jgi:putative FmdB family regulatory protein
MPIYPYKCNACGHRVEVVRSIKETAGEQPCPECDEPMAYVFTRTTVIGAAVQHAEFNPGLGLVTKNKQHREEIAKQRGLIEVGNESRESVGRKIQQDHAEKIEREWDAL